ncbi:MAG: hypothetical protein R2705_08315 [Ilumatobacteraceae bacterium]
MLGDTGFSAAPLTPVGDPATREELDETLGADYQDLWELTMTMMLALADADAQRIGVPGGGGVMRASDLARYYQALLHDPQGLWVPAVLHDATSRASSAP